MGLLSFFALTNKRRDRPLEKKHQCVSLFSASSCILSTFSNRCNPHTARNIYKKKDDKERLHRGSWSSLPCGKRGPPIGADPIFSFYTELQYLPLAGSGVRRQNKTVTTTSATHDRSIFSILSVLRHVVVFFFLFFFGGSDPTRATVVMRLSRAARQASFFVSEGLFSYAARVFTRLSKRG